jgi:hypothetical protein
MCGPHEVGRSLNSDHSLLILESPMSSRLSTVEIISFSEDVATWDRFVSCRGTVSVLNCIAALSTLQPRILHMADKLWGVHAPDKAPFRACC